MRKFFEHFLLSLLLGLSCLLGLSFWLNTMFGFNMFFDEHWAEIARLQAEHIPISNGFYVSIGIAIFIFVFGLCCVYLPSFKHTQKKAPAPAPVPVVSTNYAPIISEEKHKDLPVEPKILGTPMARPPRLNLPTNMAQIAKARHENITLQQPTNQPQKDSSTQYNSKLSEIFKDAGYVVKPNITVSGFSSNLFAIAPDEVMWIGAIDKDINKLQSAIDRLNSLFQETLEDIQINVNAFMIDTNGHQESTDSVLVLKSFDDLRKLLSDMPAVSTKDLENYEQENFNAYSEYVDTIIQYVKNIG